MGMLCKDHTSRRDGGRKSKGNHPLDCKAAAIRALGVVMLDPHVAVENLPRLQYALSRDDASGLEGFKASVRNPRPKIDEVIFLVGFRHLIDEFQCGSLPIRNVAKASNGDQEAIAAVVRLFTTIHKLERRPTGLELR